MNIPSRQEIKESLQSIASDAGYSGSAVDFIISLASTGYYETFLRSIGILREANADTAANINSLITMAVNRMYSTFRGNCPRLILKGQSTRYQELKRGDKVYSSENFNLYVYTDITLTPNTDFSIELIASPEYIFSSKKNKSDRFYVDFRDNDLSEDINLYVQTDQTAFLNNDYGVLTTPKKVFRLFSQNLSSILDITIQGWGVRYYRYTKGDANFTISAFKYLDDHDQDVEEVINSAMEKVLDGSATEADLQLEISNFIPTYIGWKVDKDEDGVVLKTYKSVPRETKEELKVNLNSQIDSIYMVRSNSDLLDSFRVAFANKISDVNLESYATEGSTFTVENYKDEVHNIKVEGACYINPLDRPFSTYTNGTSGFVMELLVPVSTRNNWKLTGHTPDEVILEVVHRNNNNDAWNTLMSWTDLDTIKRWDANSGPKITIPYGVYSIRARADAGTTLNISYRNLDSSTYPTTNIQLKGNVPTDTSTDYNVNPSTTSIIMDHDGDLILNWDNNWKCDYVPTAYRKLTIKKNDKVIKWWAPNPGSIGTYTDNVNKGDVISIMFWADKGYYINFESHLSYLDSTSTGITGIDVPESFLTNRVPRNSDVQYPMVAFYYVPRSASNLISSGEMESYNQAVKYHYVFDHLYACPGNLSTYTLKADIVTTDSTQLAKDLAEIINNYTNKLGVTLSRNELVTAISKLSEVSIVNELKLLGNGKEYSNIHCKSYEYIQITVDLTTS